MGCILLTFIKLIAAILPGSLSELLCATEKTQLKTSFVVHVAAYITFIFIYKGRQTARSHILAVTWLDLFVRECSSVFNISCRNNEGSSAVHRLLLVGCYSQLLLVVANFYSCSLPPAVVTFMLACCSLVTWVKHNRGQRLNKPPLSVITPQNIGGQRLRLKRRLKK